MAQNNLNLFLKSKKKKTMNDQFQALKDKLFKVQDLLDSNNTISDELKAKIKADLEELDDLVYDLQQDFPSAKSNHGYLRFHFHRINSVFYKKLVNFKKSLREQKLYLQFSMYSTESDNSFSRNSSSSNLANESVDSTKSNQNDSQINIEIIDEDNFTNSNYETILTSLYDKNLYVLRESKFFKHFFDSCDERAIDVDLNFKSIQSYINFNNLKVRLKHFIKEDLIDLREKSDKVRELNTNDSDSIDEEIKQKQDEISQDIENLNKLEIEVDLAFSFYQRKFVLFALNLNENELNILFYNKSEVVTNINEKFKKYALFFHPDKNMSNYDILNELFYKISNLKCKIISSNLSSKYDLQWYTEEGMSLFNIGQDYYNCFKKQFSDIKFLDKESLDLGNVDEAKVDFFKKLSNYHFEQAYEKFREACFIADEAKLFDQMLEIRLKISNCFDKIDNRHLEAQLAALACLYLVNRKYPDKYNTAKKQLAQENLDNLKAKNNAKTKVKKQNKTLSVCVNQQDQIEINGIKIFREFLNVDKQLIRFHANKSN